MLNKIAKMRSMTLLNFKQFQMMSSRISKLKDSKKVEKKDMGFLQIKIQEGRLKLKMDKRNKKLHI